MGLDSTATSPCDSSASSATLTLELPPPKVSETVFVDAGGEPRFSLARLVSSCQLMPKRNSLFSDTRTIFASTSTCRCTEAWNELMYDSTRASTAGGAVTKMLPAMGLMISRRPSLDVFAVAPGAAATPPSTEFATFTGRAPATGTVAADDASLVI